MRGMLLAVLLCGMGSAMAESYAKVEYTGVIETTKDKVFLKTKDDIKYQLMFPSDSTLSGEAYEYVGMDVIVIGLLDLEAKPGSTSKLLLWPSKLEVVGADAPPSRTISTTQLPINRDIKPNGVVPEHVISERLPTEKDADINEPFRGPEHESYAPKFGFKW